jgi:monofunctional biosynthetic peptidoglycan transglycosylase
MRDWERSSGKRASWRPVTLASLPAHVPRAVIVAEDAGFWGHGGFDVDAFKEAMSENVSRGRMAFGGSTISQQTAKNLFLTPSRTPLRKWHELVFTWGLERNASKKRILEIYLNDAELGTGIYGVEAAAQTYYTIPATALSPEQAVELAASLPSPKKHNPLTRTKRWANRVKKIQRHLDRWDSAKPAPTPSATPEGGLPHAPEEGFPALTTNSRDSSR